MPQIAFRNFNDLPSECFNTSFSSNSYCGLTLEAKVLNVELLRFSWTFSTLSLEKLIFNN